MIKETRQTKETKRIHIRERDLNDSMTIISERVFLGSPEYEVEFEVTYIESHIICDGCGKDMGWMGEIPMGHLCSKCSREFSKKMDSELAERAAKNARQIAAAEAAEDWCQ